MAQSMISPDDFLKRVIKSSNKPQELFKFLHSPPAMHFVKTNSSLTQLLGQLDFSTHSMAVVVILNEELNGSRELRQEWLIDAANALTVSKRDHVQADPIFFSILGLRYFEIMEKFDMSRHAVSTLSSAVQILQGNPQSITPIHHCLLKACLSSQFYDLASSIAIQPYTALNKGISPKHLLEFFLYAGIALCGIKKFDAAARHFASALCIPADAISEIAVESYKRYVLSCLIRYGKILPLSKAQSSGILKAYADKCAPYKELEPFFDKSGTLDKLDAFIAEHQETFQKDDCLGLVKQARKAWFRHNILRLTNTFVTLSLEDIAKRASLPDAATAEKEILSMMKEGLVWVSIDDEQGVVSFEDDPNKYDGADSLEDLVAQLTLLQKATKHIEALDLKISISEEYIAKKHVGKGGFAPAQLEGDDYED